MLLTVGYVTSSLSGQCALVTLVFPDDGRGRGLGDHGTTTFIPEEAGLTRYSTGSSVDGDCLDAGFCRLTRCAGPGQVEPPDGRRRHWRVAGSSNM